MSLLTDSPLFQQYNKAELDAAATEAKVLSFFQAKGKINCKVAMSQMTYIGNLLQHTDVGQALKTVSKPGSVFHEYLKKCKNVPATFGKGSGGHNQKKQRNDGGGGKQRTQKAQNQALRGGGKQRAKKQRSDDGGGKQRAKKQRNDGGGGKKRAKKQSDAEEFDAEEFYAEAPAEYTNFTAI